MNYQIYGRMPRHERPIGHNDASGMPRVLEDFTMTTFMIVIAMLASQSVAALAQTQQSAPKPRDEIRQLFVQLRDAATKHDRAAIER